MKKLALALFLPFLLQANGCTEISMPCFAGGFYGGASWIYLQATHSDGDLEFGSFITPTLDFTAHLLQTEPDYKSGYQLNLGYEFGCTNQNLDARFFSIDHSSSNSAQVFEDIQLIQNFLGGNFGRAKGASTSKIRDLAVTYGLEYIIDQCLSIHPYLGVGFADIRRTLDVSYDDEGRAFGDGMLQGTEKSKYWGVGPIIGWDASLPLFCNLSLSGRFGTGVLFGTTKSSLDSTSFFQNENSAFFAKDSSDRAVTLINGDVSLSYLQPLCGGRYGMELEVGYRADYYFKPINRINPFLGYVVNTNPFPVDQPSNIGLHGPYITLSFTQGCPCSYVDLCSNSFCNACDCSGLHFNFTSSWLEPCPTGDDLAYAFLQSGNVASVQKVHPDRVWTGRYELSYQFESTWDITANYFHLGAKDTSKTTASANQTISSINASGAAEVVYTNAQSKVKYDLDQVDASIGKSIQAFCPLNLHGSFGVRWLDLKRTQDKGYFGGFPPLQTQTKTPFLKSTFCGVGPSFGLDPTLDLFWGFSIKGETNASLVIGNLKAIQNQDNFGALVAESSNDLDTPKTTAIVPIVDARGGLHYELQCSCVGFEIEAGYQFTEYYRAVNLLFPVFLTGLGQNNTNLRLTGPYLDVGVNVCF
ncbi:MAG: Lpg1974 family pore-forming outer membrane protein [Simkaniaceae bacterium]|nr:Lpg1974 family pore-forming outer membrane protein [Candidatus Sacchlamyda saccharinae]